MTKTKKTPSQAFRNMYGHATPAALSGRWQIEKDKFGSQSTRFYNNLRCRAVTERRSNGDVIWRLLDEENAHRSLASGIAATRVKAHAAADKAAAKACPR